MNEIYVEIVNPDGEVVERITVVGERSFDAIERLVDGFGYEVRRV